MTNSSKPYTLPLAVSCTSNSLRDAGLSITFPWVAADGVRLGGFALGRNPNTRACSQAKQTRQEMSHKWRYTTGNRVRWIFQPFVHWWSRVLLSETQSLVEKCYCSQNDVYSRRPFNFRELELSWDMFSMRFKTNWLLMFSWFAHVF